MTGRLPNNEDLFCDVVQREAKVVLLVANAQTFACDKADRVPLRPPVQNSFAVLPDAVLGIASEEAE